MPSRNIVRLDVADSFYHVYGRGVARGAIFLDDDDYATFLNILKRYLSREPQKDTNGREYKTFYGAVELVCFCLMPNHFHLLFYQRDEHLIAHVMQPVIGSYSRYFNNKYDRSGPLLESRYKSSRISNDTYLLHISRYIHLNPDKWKQWPWSSREYFIGSYSASWVKPERILELFGTKAQYQQFVEEYIGRRDELKAALSHELAE
jgi:putative transposase